MSASIPSSARGLSVGVTLYIRDETQQLWENGIFQNCYFLLMLLQRSPIVKRCFVVNGGPGKPSPGSDFVAAAPAPVIDLQEAMNELDVIIELSAQLDAQWARDFHARGGKIIGMHVANDFVIDIERMIYGLSHGMLFSGAPYDALWTLPAFEQTCASYYRVGFRAPVAAMPHLWSPHFIARAMRAKPDGPEFAYRPGASRWRIAILEPNICSVKTCHLPLLACDVAHRRNGAFIEVVRVFNALKIKEHPGFIGFAGSLDLVQQGIATFEARYPIFDVLPNFANAIVSHHWRNAQNYLYYEALHGGFPLIHNSQLLGGCGYFYRTYDSEDGALALVQAFLEHDRGLQTYRRRSDAFLRTLDPVADENVRTYSEAIAALFDSASEPEALRP